MGFHFKMAYMRSRRAYEKEVAPIPPYRIHVGRRSKPARLKVIGMWAKLNRMNERPSFRLGPIPFNY